MKFMKLFVILFRRSIDNHIFTIIRFLKVGKELEKLYPLLLLLGCVCFLYCFIKLHKLLLNQYWIVSIRVISHLEFQQRNAHSIHEFIVLWQCISRIVFVFFRQLNLLLLKLLSNVYLIEKLNLVYPLIIELSIFPNDLLHFITSFN